MPENVLMANKLLKCYMEKIRPWSALQATGQSMGGGVMEGMLASEYGRILTPSHPVFRVAPFVILVLAGIAVRSPLAVAHPFAALLIFFWIIFDTILLTGMASAGRRPGLRIFIGAFAGASVTVALGVPPAVRAILWSAPALAAGMAIAVLTHVGLAATRARRSGVRGDEWKARLIAIASELLPLGLVQLVVAEMTVIHMALFRWGGPADVPANGRAFAYHKHLAPMCVTLLVLSTIEIAVYHLLIGHWSRAGAIVLFILSDVGFIYLLGLIKSFRFRPILVTQEGVRIRSGLLIDHLVPFETIERIETNFSGESVRDPEILNAALLAWPNILLRLSEPLCRSALLKGRRAYRGIAFRLDDPEPFVRILQWRLGGGAMRK